MKKKKLVRVRILGCKPGLIQYKKPFHEPGCPNLYEDELGLPTHPGQAFLSMMGKAADLTKEKFSRRLLSKTLPMLVRVVEDRVPLYDPENGSRSLIRHPFEILFKRLTGHSVTVSHAAWLCPKWEAQFHLLIWTEALDENAVKSLLFRGSQAVGIGAMRPEFGDSRYRSGRFDIVEWNACDSSKLKKPKRDRKAA